MRTYDFTPLFRSTIGFDRLVDLMENTARNDWPPYNIEKLGEDQYRIWMAIVGFGQDDIELTQQGNVLTVVGQRKSESPQAGVLHQGLAFRDFKQTFNLADHVKVSAANLENGLLSIELVREVPEQLKPRRIEVGQATAIANDRQGQPTLANDAGKRAA
jgi:molecular chaperone IbpA